MISELTFSRKFTSFWNQLLPNANNFIRIINGSLIEDVYPPLDESANRANNVFVNECAFNLYKAIQNGSIDRNILSVPGLFHSADFQTIFEQTKEYLKRFSYGSNFKLPLSMIEYNTIREMAKSIFSRYGEINQVEVSPNFDGCGVINNSYGDICYSNILVEIKSGDRKFSVYDLRQILIYFTLNFYSKNKRGITSFELFNPRMGIIYSDSIVNLCKELAFIQAEELYFEIMNSITEENFIETEMQR
ncbi:hypothetical protein ACX928_16235 [Enterobacter roggenkampii]|uniref:hypothetical protein n=1 Tax=Enterobacter TaxID=547 RepID=UPI0003BF2502|nr:MULTISPECIES: hypothetical protein [Enterobacter]ELS5727355.1 hypothetical protein [Enterobacter roggenkampii]ELS5730967.1 hypothetical protein [Enterobacter roggenkampii]ELT0932019.1 hypothetical protein [Enterobacter roggenkampii]ELT0936148.1 hypothetical protein [Enterobacter roggenkampii]ESL83461.1 hypothetical protein L423_01730 [Enterobacter roggenkampii]